MLATSLPEALAYQSGGVLPSGKLVVSGGARNDLTASDTVLYYDYALNQWIPGTPLTDARYFHVSILLPNGRVLVHGGQSDTLVVLPFWEQILDP